MTFRNKRLYLFLAAVQAGLAFSQTQPTYRPDEVTAYLSVDLQAIEKSKLLATVSPDAAKQVAAGREQIRQGLKIALGIDSQDLVAEKAQVMVFANNFHQAAAVIRGNWSADRANEVLKAAESHLPSGVTKLTHGDHPVVVVNGQAAGELATATQQHSLPVASLASDEAYISIHEKGPVVIASGMTALGRVLDALDTDPVKGDGRFLPEGVLQQKVDGRDPLVTFWLKDVPGENARSNLPGPLKGVSAIAFALWETDDTLSLGGGITMPSQSEAIKVKTMADGALMFATSTIDNPDFKAVLASFSTTVVGNTVRVRWEYPISKLAFLNEEKAPAPASQAP